MPTAVFSAPLDPEPWRTAFGKCMPELRFDVWPRVRDSAGIDYLLAWGDQSEPLKRLPSLRGIFSLGAGVDHLVGATLQGSVPVIRLVDPALTAGMVEYALYNVIRFHRSMHLYEAAQRVRQWAEFPQVRAIERRVGVMGLGELGAACATQLVALGFDVAGWSRTGAAPAGVESFQGAEGLVPFLQRSQILLCLLPLTGQTEGILNRRVLSLLPQGAMLINAGRGPLLVEGDLCGLLSEGHLGGAALDVFETEPLSAESPLWDTPNVFITPHVASLTDPAAAAAVIANNMRRDQRGAGMAGIVNRHTGY